MINRTQNQHSLDWHRNRLGQITGSKVGLLMKNPRSGGGFSATAKTYLYQLAGERRLNPAIVADDQMLEYFLEQTSTQSKAMRFGNEQEENARQLYCETRGIEVEEVGLCPHDSIPFFASSPDGIISGQDSIGCVEIKCPSISTFSQYCDGVCDNESLLKANPDYYYQTQAHMACTDAQFCDFVVYCPFVCNPIHIVRIERDNTAIAEMESRVKLAEEEIRKFSQSI